MFDKGCIKRDVSLLESKDVGHLQHQISLSVIDETIISEFKDWNNCKYDEVDKRLILTINDEFLKDIVPIISELLKNYKIASYDIKLKNLSDDYEEYINE